MTIVDATRDFVDHIRLHEPCLDACLTTFAPERADEHLPETLKRYCDEGARTLMLAIRRMR